MMEARATARFLRLAPRKARVVTDLIRGQEVAAALSILRFTPKAASVPVEKVLRSAMANVTQSEGGSQLDVDHLLVKDVRVEVGPVMKRYRPRARGRGDVRRRRTCHVTVVVAAPQEP
jgi:large subunit ribosomal protein L22